jgi:hypothetical protein
VPRVLQLLVLVLVLVLVLFGPLVVWVAWLARAQDVGPRAQQRRAVKVTGCLKALRWAPQ